MDLEDSLEGYGDHSTVIDATALTNFQVVTSHLISDYHFDLTVDHKIR